MINVQTHRPEAVMALKFTGVSLVGFGVDYAILHALMAMGVSAAWARVISLFCAMQVTFVLNGLHVFQALDKARPVRQWLTYMGSHGCGNFCNYWIFVTLISTHWRIVSIPLVALLAGSFMAWIMNYACARLLVFGRVRLTLRRNVPSPP